MWVERRAFVTNAYAFPNSKSWEKSVATIGEMQKSFWAENKKTLIGGVKGQGCHFWEQEEELVEKKLSGSICYFFL